MLELIESFVFKDIIFKIKMPAKQTPEQYIDRAKEKHDDFYDYSKVIYKNINIKVVIICPEHGEFKQTPSNHLTGNGCPRCRDSKGEKKVI